MIGMKETFNERKKKKAEDKIPADKERKKDEIKGRITMRRIEDAVATAVVNKLETGKFKNLDEAVEFINSNSQGMINASSFESTNQATRFLEDIINKSPAASEQFSQSQSQSTVDPASNISFTGSFNREYTNKPDDHFFDNAYVFSLNDECKIRYILDHDDDDAYTIYIEFITCTPTKEINPEEGNFIPISATELFKDNNAAIKGSGTIMLYDLCHFLKRYNLIDEHRYTEEDSVYLTPESSAGRDEHAGKNLVDFYTSLGFVKVQNSEKYTSQIKTIMRSRRMMQTLELFNSFEQYIRDYGPLPEEGSEASSEASSKASSKETTLRKFLEEDDKATATSDESYEEENYGETQGLDGGRRKTQKRQHRKTQKRKSKKSKKSKKSRRRR